MSFAEDYMAAGLDYQKRYGHRRMVEVFGKPTHTSMSGIATGSMWNGVSTALSPAKSLSRAKEIIAAVAFVTNMNEADMLSGRRWRRDCEARQIAYWFLRHYTTHSFPTIGRLVGGKHHATVLHGVRQVDRYPRRFGSRLEGVARYLNLRLPEANKISVNGRSSPQLVDSGYNPDI